MVAMSSPASPPCALLNCADCSRPPPDPDLDTLYATDLCISDLDLDLDLDAGVAEPW